MIPYFNKLSKTDKNSFLYKFHSKKLVNKQSLTRKVKRTRLFSLELKTLIRELLLLSISEKKLTSPKSNTITQYLYTIFSRIPASAKKMEYKNALYRHQRILRNNT